MSSSSKRSPTGKHVNGNRSAISRSFSVDAMLSSGTLRTPFLDFRRSIRCVTHQVTPDRGFSQRALATQHCESVAWSISEVRAQSEYLDSVPSFSTKRASLRRLRNPPPAGRLFALICWDMPRIVGRSATGGGSKSPESGESACPSTCQRQCTGERRFELSALAVSIHGVRNPVGAPQAIAAGIRSVR